MTHDLPLLHRRPDLFKWIEDMNKQTYWRSFRHFVEGKSDPHECWQSDGFWPDRADAELEHLFVWGTIIGLTYLENGGMVAYLQFISGRTLPEMENGFAILGCVDSKSVCTTARRRFGEMFPRDDKARAQFVAQDRTFFDGCDEPMWQAMATDDYETRIESYCRAVCTANSIWPM
jgi:hypothetical protein